MGVWTRWRFEKRLSHPFWKEREAAIKEVGARASVDRAFSDEAVKLLGRALGRGYDWETMETVVDALGDTKNPKAIALIKKAVEMASLPEEGITRIAAGRALGQIGHPDAVPLLGELVGDENVNVREEAARAIRKIGRNLVCKKAETSEARALQLVAPHMMVGESPEVVEKAYEAALKGGINKANAALYVKQLRAMQGKLK